MPTSNRSNALLLAAAGLGLTGCVAAVPVQPTLTVIPGEGKTEANLRADDVACRAAQPVQTNGATTTTTTVVPVTADQYYACMAAKGEAVIQQAAQAYPVYTAPVAYPAYGYGYGYGYPYGGYSPYGYGYPYYGGYYGPYVGFGVGFGYGRFYGHGFRGGYGGYRGWGGGFHGGYRGWGGGGFHGGFRR